MLQENVWGEADVAYLTHCPSIRLVGLRKTRKLRIAGMRAKIERGTSRISRSVDHCTAATSLKGKVVPVLFLTEHHVMKAY